MMRKPLTRFLLVAATAASLFQSPVASAFRTTADLDDYGEPAARWSTSVFFRLHDGGPVGLPPADLQQAMVPALRAWQEPSCSALRLHNGGFQSASAVAGDGVNTIQWVHDWSDRGFDPTAAAATDVQYEHIKSEPWTIVEADIYLNAEHFTWRIGGEDDSARDLVSVLTHEIGHALGLLHPCEPDGRDGAPDCHDFAGADGTTMHPAYDPEQATLSADDEAGLCFLYPPQTCETAGCPDGLMCTDRGCAAQCEPECAAGQRCALGHCIDTNEPEAQGGGGGASGDERGRASFGDPCTTEDECVTGFCEKGTCSERCQADTDCSLSDAKCEEDRCVSSRASIGQSCSESEECLGSQCLAIDGEPAVCTRACEANSDCPPKWSCEVLEGRTVCAPPWALVAGGGACTMPATAAARSGRLIPVCCALALGVAFFSRRRLRTASSFFRISRRDS